MIGVTFRTEIFEVGEPMQQLFVNLVQLSSNPGLFHVLILEALEMSKELDQIIIYQLI